MATSNLSKPLPPLLDTDNEKASSSPYSTTSPHDDSDPSESTSFLPASSHHHHDSDPHHHARPRKPRPILTHPLTLIYASLTTLLLLNSLVLFLTLRHPSPNPHSQIPTSSTAPLYAFPNSTLFRPHPDYESFEDRFDRLWTGMQTPNGGFYIKELDSSELSSAEGGEAADGGLGGRGRVRRHGGHDGRERHTFGIAMFHQLHCLGYLRDALKLLDGVARGVAERDGVVLEGSERGEREGGEGEAEGDEEEGLEEKLRKLIEYQDRFGVTQRGRWDAVHVGHCVDYIRQSILCAADATIEPPGTLGMANSLDMISGHDVLHQCRDANAVWDMSVQSGWVDEDVHPEEVVESPFRGRV